ncbi:hypothetical protein ACS0TY_014002 [Phlomoides rotata]
MAEDLAVMAAHIRSLVSSQIQSQLQALHPSSSGEARQATFAPSGNSNFIQDIVRSQVEALFPLVPDSERRCHSPKTLDPVVEQTSFPTETGVPRDYVKGSTPAACGETLLREPRTTLKSFVDALTGTPSTESREEEHREMVATRKGEFLSVTLDDLLVKRGVDELQNSLIARLIHAKGEEPYLLETLTRKLEATWNISGGWKLIPIGRGYYNVQLSNLDDRDRILGRTSWSLKPGVIRVQRWVWDFHPYKTSTSIAQVWVRLFEIPMEYF